VVLPLTGGKDDEPVPKVCPRCGHKLRIEQNPRCPPSGYVGFWAALVFEIIFPGLVKPNPQKNFRSICQSVLALQSGIQNPRCPPGGHFGFWAVLVFEEPPHRKSNRDPTGNPGGIPGGILTGIPPPTVKYGQNFWAGLYSGPSHIFYGDGFPSGIPLSVEFCKIPVLSQLLFLWSF
jgi:hypothetical protein